MVRGTRGVALLAVAAAAIATIVPARPAPASRAAPATRVTVIGDSSMIDVVWHVPANTLLTRGLDVRLDVRVCRRLVGESCPYEGERPPNLVDTVAAMGTGLGLVVVVGGYNEPEPEFAAAVAASLDALVRAGATRILWPTLSEASPMFGRMNGTLAEIADARPELTLLDWNRYSSTHNDWFQTDHIHLTDAGALGLAGFLRAEIDRALVAAAPLRPAPETLTATVTPSLTAGSVGRQLVLRLRARGGTPPYRWKVAVGRLPAGLHLVAADVRGLPTRTGRTSVTFAVTDAWGSVARRRVTFEITPRRR